MARTKIQPEPAPQPPVVNGSVQPPEVLTLAEAAAYLRLPEKAVLGAVSTQGLPGRLVGIDWRFSKAAIQQWLGVSPPTVEMRKAAILSVAGTFKDDPNLFPILDEAMKRRGREPAPDGTYEGV